MTGINDSLIQTLERARYEKSGERGRLFCSESIRRSAPFNGLGVLKE